MCRKNKANTLFDQILIKHTKEIRQVFSYAMLSLKYPISRYTNIY